MVKFRALNRRNAVPDAGIAQMVEQRTCNAKVPSSILGAGTRSQSDWASGGVGEWLKPADCKSVAYGYAGSNPAPSTKFNLYARTGRVLFVRLVSHQPGIRNEVPFTWQKKSLSVVSRT